VALDNGPLGLAGSAGSSRSQPEETPLTNIDPQLCGFLNPTSTQFGVPEEQPSSFHQRCNSECEAEHLAQANMSLLGATPQLEAGRAAPDNTEDGQLRLKELHEAATRSQSRTFI
jgi:hypothetical protein